MRPRRKAQRLRGGPAEARVCLHDVEAHVLSYVSEPAGFRLDYRMHPVTNGSSDRPPMSNPAPTTPEAALRRRLHAHGLRFARTARDLPSRPDLVLPKRRSVVFVHDCFWHGHDCTPGRVAPKFKVGAWAEKIAANRDHDQLDGKALRAAGWHVEIVWECQAEQPAIVDRLAARLLKR